MAPAAKKAKVVVPVTSTRTTRSSTRASRSSASTSPVSRSIPTSTASSSVASSSSSPRVAVASQRPISPELVVESEEEEGDTIMTPVETKEEDDEFEFEYSDDEAEMVDALSSIEDNDELEADDEEDENPLPAPVSKGKLTSRQQLQADIADLVREYSSNNGNIKHFAKTDDGVEFTLTHPTYAAGIKVLLMVPESSGYPLEHQFACFSECDAPEAELGVDVAKIVSEISELPQTGCDRSIRAITQYLYLRIQGEPAPAAYQHPIDETDEEEEHDDYNDEFLGINAGGYTAAAREYLCKDFRHIIDAGFRPGFTRISDLGYVVSVSVKVNALGVPLQNLQAWDAELITGKQRYIVLLLNFSKYPISLDGSRSDVTFRVGISSKYKPSKTAIASAFRLHTIDVYTPNEFDPISLSQPLTSLMCEKFQEILLIRYRNPSLLSWAAAEYHVLQCGTNASVDKKACDKADQEEKVIAATYTIPKDPLLKSATSKCYPLIAFQYLIRRFVTCPLYCLDCFNKIEDGVICLKPYVCGSALCLFQFMALGLGPSLEYEIKTNAPAVDLLVQLMYSAAQERNLTSFPVGLGLNVPVTRGVAYKSGDAVTDFDALDDTAKYKYNGVVDLINALPRIAEMRSFLLADGLSSHERSLAKARKLQDLLPETVSLSSWQLLRWIVASNPSFLKHIEDEDELVQGISRSYRQFRLIVGSPAKEHFLTENIKQAQISDVNSRTFPTLFGFHGSSLKNWNNILREGLHFKKTTNGRAYGHGVYFAKTGETSLGTYATGGGPSWKNADFVIGSMSAICEIVNLPKQFVSTSPYFVVAQLDWIACRYLIVKRGTSNDAPTVVDPDAAQIATQAATRTRAAASITTIPLDPAHPITLDGTPIKIPNLLPKLEALDSMMRDTVETLNDSDTELLREPSIAIVRAASSSQVATKKPVDSFVPCSDELLSLIKLLPPPPRPNAGASLNIRREMKSMIAQQATEGPSAAGFYFDPERSDGNIFTWVIELLGFDPDLPLMKDMKAKNIKSILMEIRFPESYPISPPFFRIVYPRLLPFIQGGGGHVTGGGSLCMDLLTSDGWSPAYAIPAVLLQIRMAMSNLEPRPARLDPSRWKEPYNMSEAIEGFKRVAFTHGWALPTGFDEISRQE